VPGLFLALFTTTSDPSILNAKVRAGNVRLLRQNKRANNNLQQQGGDEHPDWEMEAQLSEFSVFDFEDILDATDKFSLENKLGEGGFGPVYKVLCSKIYFTVNFFYATLTILFYHQIYYIFSMTCISTYLH